MIRKSILIYLVVFLLIGNSIALGQTPDDTIVIGSIQIVDHPDLNESLEGFKAALTESGFTEDSNIRYIVNKNPSGKIDGVKEAIAGYISEKVDLIFAITVPCALTAVKATSEIPIVFAAVRDPVDTGIIKSMENPGANATGVALVYPLYNLTILARDLIPDLKKITLIEDKNKALKAEMENSLSNQLKDLGLDLKMIYIADKSEIDPLVDSLKGKTDCIIANNNMEVIKAMDSLISASLRNNIPLITTNEPSVAKGALATSAVDYFKEGQKAGLLAAKILNGASPSNIPTEDPTAYRLIINAKTAKSMGIIIPSRFRRMADRIIE